MTKESPISPYMRPALLIAVAFMAFGVAIISGIIDGFTPGFGQRFGMSVMAVAAKVPDSYFSLFEIMFVTYGLGKSGEKIAKHWKSPEMLSIKMDQEND